jgi:hypothetical protein
MTCLYLWLELVRGIYISVNDLFDTPLNLL